LKETDIQKPLHSHAAQLIEQDLDQLTMLSEPEYTHLDTYRETSADYQCSGDRLADGRWLRLSSL
jgi:hypothetical protein